MKKVLTIVLIILTTSLFAQKTMKYTFDAAKSLMIAEAMVMVVTENNKLVVAIAIPGTTAEGAEKIDLKKGDEILYINGKKVKELEELKKYYEEVKTGTEVKLGVNRKENKFFVTFKKREPTTGMNKAISIGGDGKNIKVGSGAIIIGPDGKARDSKGKEISKEKMKEIKSKMDSLKENGKIQIYKNK
jgi:C-terminal processing protease CtpA/Prc